MEWQLQRGKGKEQNVTSKEPSPGFHQTEKTGGKNPPRGLQWTREESRDLVFWTRHPWNCPIGKVLADSIDLDRGDHLTIKTGWGRDKMVV
jgi:hypothetical protein